MKKNSKDFARALVLVSALGGLYPQLASSAPGWTAYGTVEEVYPNPAGYFFVRLTVSTNPHLCGGQGWFSHTGVGDGASRVFAALLSAHATGKPVRLYVTGNCDSNNYSDFSSASVIH